MKHTLRSMFNRQCSAVTKPRKNKLVLHFDVNKTIVPVDSATGETVEAALNIYLSGMAWGKDKAGEWHLSKRHPSNSPFETDDVSFYKFEERRLLRHLASDRATLRTHLTSFTEIPQGSNFKPFLNRLLQKLKWNLPYEEVLHKPMTVPGTKYYRYHFILPSFYKLLVHLVSEERDFAIIFRTFGSDAKNVLSSLKLALSNNMPFCQNLQFLEDTISENEFVLQRSDACRTFSFHGLKTQCVHLKTDDEMYTELSNFSGIAAIRDNVEDWYSSNFHPNKGKPMWIDHSDDKTHHIFFDDNIRPGKPDSIVNLRVRDSTNSFRNVTSVEELKFVNRNIVPVDFSTAIMNEDYFVQKLAVCEENNARWTPLNSTL